MNIRVLLVMCAGMFLVLLDITVVNVALPSIGAALHAGTAGAQWVVDGYAVALAALLLTSGALGDRLGHRRLVLIGLLLFCAASIGCGLAPGIGLLIAARAAQGAAAALLLPGCLAVITDAHPEPAARARALGVWAGLSSLALPAGPLLGGLLVSTAGWRWVSLVNPVVIAAAVVGVLAWVPARPGRRPAGRFDVRGAIGAAITLAAVVSTVIALGRGAAPVLVAAAGTVAVLAAVASGVHARRTAEPLVPPELWRRRTFAGANAAAPCMNLASNGTLFVTTLYLQAVLGRSAISAGCMLLPMFVPIAILSPVAGRLTARHGSRLPMIAGAVVSGLGELCLLLVSPHSGYAALVPMMLGIGIGNGLFTAPVVAAAVGSVPADRSGLASGVVNTVRQAGTALGVAVFGAVAGSTADPDGFVAGLHRLAVVGGLLWLLALAITLLTVPSLTRSP